MPLTRSFGLLRSVWYTTQYRSVSSMSLRCSSALASESSATSLPCSGDRQEEVPAPNIAGPKRMSRDPVTITFTMPLEKKRIDVRRFDPTKMQKVSLFETPHLFCDVYCLEPGQMQKPHRHEGADKVYAVLEGEVLVRVGSEGEVLEAGAAVLAPAGVDHAVENKGPARAAVLVFMAPKP